LIHVIIGNAEAWALRYPLYTVSRRSKLIKSRRLPLS